MTKFFSRTTHTLISMIKNDKVSHQDNLYPHFFVKNDKEKQHGTSFLASKDDSDIILLGTDYRDSICCY